jgi:hypothetical protein
MQRKDHPHFPPLNQYLVKQGKPGNSVIKYKTNTHAKKLFMGTMLITPRGVDVSMGCPPHRTLTKYPELGCLVFWYSSNTTCFLKYEQLVMPSFSAGIPQTPFLAKPSLISGGIPAVEK